MNNKIKNRLKQLEKAYHIADEYDCIPDPEFDANIDVDLTGLEHLIGYGLYEITQDILMLIRKL